MQIYPEEHEMTQFLVRERVLPENVAFFVREHLLSCTRCQNALGRRAQAYIQKHRTAEPDIPEEATLPPACGITRHYGWRHTRETPNDLQSMLNLHIDTHPDCSVRIQEDLHLIRQLRNIPLDGIDGAEQLLQLPRRRQQHRLRILLIIIVVAVIVILLFLYR